MQPDRNFYKLELSDFSEGASHAGWRELLIWLRDRFGIDLDDPETGLVWRCTFAKLVVMDGTPNSPGNRHQDGEFGGDWRLIVDLGDFLNSDHKDASGRCSGGRGSAGPGEAGGAESSALSTSREYPAVSSALSTGEHPATAIMSSGSASSRRMHFYRIVSGGPVSAGKEARVVTPVFSTAATVLAMNGRAAGSPARLTGTSRSPFVHERSGRGVSAVFDLTLCSAATIGAL